MSNTSEKVDEKLQEAWEHVKPHIGQESTNAELRKMCEICEAWGGTEHNYKDCRNKPCFKFWLAYQYLLWETSWE